MNIQITKVERNSDTWATLSFKAQRNGTELEHFVCVMVDSDPVDVLAGIRNSANWLFQRHDQFGHLQTLVGTEQEFDCCPPEH